MDKIVVTGCGNCPFQSKEFNFCEHPLFLGGLTIDWDYWNDIHQAPDWCPLKKERITIMFITES